MTFVRTFKVGARDVTITIAQNADGTAGAASVEWNPPLPEGPDETIVLNGEEFEIYKYRRDQVITEFYNTLGIDPPEQRKVH